jgi:hypothetical protein
MDNDKIDLNQLSQRELLILTVKEVRDLRKEVEQMQNDQHLMALKVNALETTSKVAGGVAGLLAGLVSAIIATLFSRCSTS